MASCAQGDGDYEICQDFIVDSWLQSKIKASEDELLKVSPDFVFQLEAD
jgi:hypothetical protein